MLIIIHIARNRVQNTAIIYPKQVQSIYPMLQTYCEDIEKGRSVIACHTLILSHICTLSLFIHPKFRFPESRFRTTVNLTRSISYPFGWVSFYRNVCSQLQLQTNSSSRKALLVDRILSRNKIKEQALVEICFSECILKTR